MPEPDAGAVASPCRRACRYRPDIGICDGCGRTLAEIEAWQAAEATAREAIRASAALRLAAWERHQSANPSLPLDDAVIGHVGSGVAMSCRS
jgi:predicted Fe-S protein YdhL (DUF1289 family)